MLINTCCPKCSHSVDTARIRGKVLEQAAAPSREMVIVCDNLDCRGLLELEITSNPTTEEISIVLVESDDRNGSVHPLLVAKQETMLMDDGTTCDVGLAVTEVPACLMPDVERATTQDCKDWLMHFSDTLVIAHQGGFLQRYVVPSTAGHRLELAYRAGYDVGLFGVQAEEGHTYNTLSSMNLLIGEILANPELVHEDQGIHKVVMESMEFTGSLIATVRRKSRVMQHGERFLKTKDRQVIFEASKLNPELPDFVVADLDYGNFGPMVNLFQSPGESQVVASGSAILGDDVNAHAKSKLH